MVLGLGRLFGRRGLYSVASRGVPTSAAEVHPPFAAYSHAAEVEPGARLVFVSGQLGIDPEGRVPEGAEAQAALCIRNVEAALRAAGCGLEHLVRLNAYVTGRDALPGYMRARDAALEKPFQGRAPPASTLMVVSGFARPEFVVEVEAVAAAR